MGKGLVCSGMAMIDMGVSGAGKSLEVSAENSLGQVIKGFEYPGEDLGLYIEMQEI